MILQSCYYFPLFSQLRQHRIVRLSHHKSIDNANNNFAVDWGDGTALDKRTNGDRNGVHTYTDAGEYTVTITGKMPSAMSFNGEQKLTSVQNGFLQNNALNMAYYFNECTNLKTIPSNLFAKSTAVTNFYATFQDCTNITLILELWVSYPSVIHTDTFTGCVQATNLQDAIDNGWATTVTP